jgi:type IV pilus assembly protein PilN
MARINLLPWREERRKVRNQETQVLLGASAVAAFLAVFLIIYQYGNVIQAQQNRNRILEEEIVKVDAKIKEIEELERTKTKLLNRKKVIEELQASRSLMVHLFDDLVRTIPEGVRLAAIKQNGEQLTLEGFAESNARVSEYMRNFEGSQWVGNPDLQIVEARGSDKRSRYAFTLKVNLKKPKGEEGDVDPAAAGADTQGAAP